MLEWPSIYPLEDRVILIKLRMRVGEKAQLLDTTSMEPEPLGYTFRLKLAFQDLASVRPVFGLGKGLNLGEQNGWQR